MGVFHFLKKALLVNESSVYSYAVPKDGVWYQENNEFGIGNIGEKIKRQKYGEPFEWPGELAINRGVGKFITDEKRIIDFGSGTGILENFWAPIHPQTMFIASELDTKTVRWCKKHRQHPNVSYVAMNTKQLVRTYGEFDLAYCIEVIEHIAEYQQFLENLTTLSDRLILTTPNRDRMLAEALSIAPSIRYHVREWNAGEVYWILRAYYTNVELYTLSDPDGIDIKRVGYMHSHFHTIAYCWGRVRKHS